MKTALWPLFFVAPLIWLVAANANAYRRVRFGPFEILPSFSLEVRQHSNVFVASEQFNDQAAADRAAGRQASEIADVSGLIFDLRPGLNISFKPRLDKTVRGLYFDLNYSPTLHLFPSAPERFVLFGDDDRAVSQGTPDGFKIDHNLRFGLRYQRSGRLTLSAGADLRQPEISASDLSIDDFLYHGGLKFDISRSMSVEGGARLTVFKTPLAEDSLTESNTPLGTFDDLALHGRFSWQIQQTMFLGFGYSRAERSFKGLDSALNDFNGDAIPDSSKDSVQQSIFGFARRRITQHTRGSFRVGKTRRDNGERQFGGKRYEEWTGNIQLETLLTPRTRVQATAELALTDTVRRIQLEDDLNAFTNDQVGQFSVLPEQFSGVRSRRFVIDLVQNVFRRGDQVLLGLAYQFDEQFDQLGTQNFFDIAIREAVIKRDLNEDLCAVPSSGDNDPETNLQRNSQFCQTILADQEQQLYLVTLGYRLRLRKWLGIQIRGSYFNGKISPLPKIEPLTPPEDIRTTYWSLSGGMVINLSVLN